MNGPVLIAPGWRCVLSEARPELAGVLKDAVICIGMHEEPLGSNRGPQIDLWLEKANAGPGSAWCASFATALYQRLDPPPIPRLASAYKIHEWALANGKLLPNDAPLQPGDICGLFKTDNSDTPAREDFHGHIGMLVSDLGNGRIATVEGNVNSYVRGLVHPRFAWQWFVRPLG